MMVATLIAIIKFQTKLNPLKGFMEDDGHENPTKENSKSKTEQIVLQGKLNYFLVFDMLGLFASLSIILLTIPTYQTQRNN